MTRRECRQRYYKKRKESGICFGCGKPNDRIGTVYCTKCVNKRSVYNKRYWKEKKKRFKNVLAKNTMEKTH